MSNRRREAMTVNERLSACGWLDAFDKAMRGRDRAEVITILRRVDLSEEQVQETTSALFARPEFYGY
jgi:hypothetical protein